uniref:recombinase family protein n=1 Tax=Ruminococcus sp. TaxID=41978 RepID=UPI00258DCAE8
MLRLRDIYSLYIKGESILGIKRILETNGVLSPTGRPTWSKKTIENILSNIKYTGMVTLSNSVDGGSYVLKQHHTAIISEYEFNTVQEMREDRSIVITDETGTHRKST